MRHAVQLGRHWSRPKVRGSYLLVLQLLPPSVKPLAGNCATLHCWRFCRSHTAIGSGILWESSAPQRLRDTFTLATLQPRSFRSRHYTQNSEGVARKHKGDTDGSKASFKSSSAAQISKIFGPAISPPVGNRLLRTIQQQRLDGKLDEASVEKDADALMIAQALFWLRQNYPMDEDAAMIRRVEREERELEEKYLAEIKKAENWRPQDRAEEEGIYGRSTFEELRKEKEERLAEERRTREADRHVRDKSLIQRAPHRAILDRRKASADWVKKYKERAQILDVWDPENVSTVRRMLPSAAFAAMFVGACYLFAQSYMPADSHHRLLPNITPSMATVGTIMAINIAIYAAWKYPPFWRIGNKYFLVVAAYPKPTSLLGSTFSHQQFHHLAGNMIFLWLVGPKREWPSPLTLLRSWLQSTIKLGVVTLYAFTSPVVSLPPLCP